MSVLKIGGSLREASDDSPESGCQETNETQLNRQYQFNGMLLSEGRVHSEGWICSSLKSVDSVRAARGGTCYVAAPSPAQHYALAPSLLHHQPRPLYVRGRGSLNHCVIKTSHQCKSPLMIAASSRSRIRAASGTENGIWDRE